MTGDSAPPVGCLPAERVATVTERPNPADTSHVRARRHADEFELKLAEANRRIVELQHQLGAQTGNDALTGLPSLNRFRIQLDIEVKRTRRHGQPLCAAVLDIDGFRAINSRHGYAIGDEVLRATGGVLGAGLRAHDLACRTGADEFAVLMPATDAAGAEIALGRVLEELDGVQIGPISSISASVGVAVLGRGDTGAQLLAAAGEGVQRARDAGGGRINADQGPDAPTIADTHRRDVVSALSVMLLERDHYTGEHSESVVNLAGHVARGLGLDDGEVAHVQAAALLHDIGKVAIPDEILNNPGALSDEQWALMRDHTIIGERILRNIPGFGGVARIIRHEHERWDGTGYPDGLEGEQIPIGSRIILACDAYHAMTSDRPYRPAMPHAEAVAELTANVGKQFDAAVIEQLVGALYGMRQAGALATHGRPAPLASR
jgi:diguanylate cyclase (GGDEF)-like protein/putative nucleotidyltransferase with HDIG domain